MLLPVAHGLSLDAAIDQFPAEVGFARYGQPEDIVNAFTFLFTAESHWITGTALRVDGSKTEMLRPHGFMRGGAQASPSWPIFQKA
jgi:hypothetical protein